MGSKKYFDKQRQEQSLRGLSKKTVAQFAENVESQRYVEEYSRSKEQFIPDYDYGKPENFAKYGSATQYYADALSRVYNQYPYDGSKAERLEFYNNLTPLEKYIFDERYPKTTGYALFSPAGWGTATAVGNPATKEYITFYGNRADNIYKTGSEQLNNLKIEYSGSGNTIEFWLKKDGWTNPSSVTRFETIFDLRTTASVDNAGHRQFEIYLDGHSSTSQRTGVLDLTGMQSNNDRFTVNVPVAIGGTGNDITIRVVAPADPSDGTANEIQVGLSSVANTRNRVVLAINGVDTSVVKYGAGSGNVTNGIAGITATAGTGATITIAAATAGGRDSIVFTDVAGTGVAAGSTGASPAILSATSKAKINVLDTAGGTSAGGAVSIISTGLDTGLSDIADSKWHHYALVVKKGSGNFITSSLYVDGKHTDSNITSSYGTGSFANWDGYDDPGAQTAIATVGGYATARIGAAGTYGTGWFKLTGSIDEFRFWKTARTGEQIGRNYFAPVYGGTNTDLVKYYHSSSVDYNKVDLGVYFKFNEGIIGDSTTDATVLDYSGRVSNGTWTGYSSNSRSTSSAIVESGIAEFESLDPIMYGTHSDVTALATELEVSGSEHDMVNIASLYNSVPQWIREEDENGNELKKLTQVVGSYLDTLYGQISYFTSLKETSYITGSAKQSTTISKDLLRSQGFEASDIFVDAGVLREVFSRDNKRVYEEKLENVKNLVYKNIYNNLTFINKSKGTEKAFRNLFRCFGTDDELFKINIYTSNAEHEIESGYETTSTKRRAIDFSGIKRLADREATVYQHPASGTGDFGYISGSYGDRDIPVTVEAQVLFPKFPKMGDYAAVDRLSESSLFGCHKVDHASDSDSTSFAGVDRDFMVSAVKVDDNRTYFKLSSTAGFFPTLTSSVFYDVYDNSVWNFAVRVRPEQYPWSSYLTASLTSSVELYGVNVDHGVVANEFLATGTMAMTGTTKSSVLFTTAMNKKLFVGAHRTNFNGSVLTKSDVRLLSFRYWGDYLTDSEITYHAKDPANFGRENPGQNSHVWEGNIGFLHVPNIDTLALHWDFDTISSSATDGTFVVEDITSGSTVANATGNQRYNVGNYSQTIKNSHPGKGYGFSESSSDVYTIEYIPTARITPPENLLSSKMIQILSTDDEALPRSSRPSKNFFAIEASMYDVISRKMLNFFSSIDDFNNQIGAPIHKYRERYKGLEKLRQLFFERVSATPDVDKFVNLYKWLDSAIESVLVNLVPASAEVSENIRTIIESHVLERNKYRHKFATAKEFVKVDNNNKLRMVQEGEAESSYDYDQLYTAPMHPTYEPTAPNAAGINARAVVVHRPYYRSSIAPTYYEIRTPPTIGSDGYPTDESESAVWWKYKAERDRGIFSKTSPTVSERSAVNARTQLWYNNKIAAISRSAMPVVDLEAEEQTYAAGVNDKRNHIWDYYRERIKDTDISSSVTATAVLDLTGMQSNNDRFTVNVPVGKGGTGANITIRVVAPADPSDGTANEVQVGLSTVANTRNRMVHAINGLDSSVVKYGAGSGDVTNGIAGITAIAGAGGKITIIAGVAGDAANNITFTDVVGTAVAAGSTGASPATISAAIGGLSASIRLDALNTLGLPFVHDQALTGGLRKYPMKVKDAKEATTVGKLYDENRLPFSVVSSSVTGGYQDIFDGKNISYAIEDLHHDIYAPVYEISMQGPFAEENVGGNMYRHGNLLFSSSASPRKEGFKILPSTPGDHDLFVVGPRSLRVSPFFDTAKPKGDYLRDNVAKSPIVIKNIGPTSFYSSAKTGSAGQYVQVGNYAQDYEVVHLSGRSENNRYFRLVSGTQPAEKDSFIGPASQKTIEFVLPDRSTGSNKFVFVNKFSNRTGIEGESEAFLDWQSGEYSPYNAMPFQNLVVKTGLNALWSRPTNRFGKDSHFTNNQSFHKVHRNTVERPALVAQSDVSLATRAGVLDLTGMQSNNDRFTVNVPTAVGGTGTDITIRVVAPADPSDGTANEIQVGLSSVANTRNRMVHAINGLDSSVVKYGDGSGDVTNGIAGITAVAGTGNTITITAVVAGDDGNDITFTDVAGTGVAAGSTGASPATLANISSAIPAQVKDNMWVSHQIPQSEINYKWINDSWLFVRTGSGPGAWAPRFVNDRFAVNSFGEPKVTDIKYLPLLGFNHSTGSEAIMFVSASDVGSIVGDAWGWEKNYVDSTYPAFHGGLMGVDFVGMNVAVYEPVSSSVNTLGFPQGIYPGTKWYSNYIKAFNGITDGFLKSRALAADDVNFTNALLLHRNGPYGWPTWKQIRTAEHPVVRYHRNNNIYESKKTVYDNARKTYVTESSRIIQTPITAKHKPIMHNLATSMIKYEFGNNKHYFAEVYDVAKNRIIDYHEDFNVYKKGLKNTMLYRSTRGQDWEVVRYSEVVYPRDENVFKSIIRNKPNYIQRWNDNLAVRQTQGAAAALPQSQGTTDFISFWQMDVNNSASVFDLSGELMQYDNSSVMPSMSFSASAYNWLPTHTDASNYVYARYGRNYCDCRPTNQVQTQAGTGAFYNSYEKYAADIKSIGQDYSIVPDFTISDYVRNVITNYDGDFYQDIYSLQATGAFGQAAGLSTTAEEVYNNATFFEKLSHTDTVTHLEELKGELGEPDSISIKMSGILKLLPVDGFYPVQRTIQLAKEFKESYFSGSEGRLSSKSAWRTALRPFYNPGIMYNTIKTGVAVDYPIIDEESDSNRVATSSNTAEYTKRLPFEAIIEPSAYARKIKGAASLVEPQDLRLFDWDPDQGMTRTYSASLGGTDGVYEKASHNFFAESVNFFVSDLTNLSSTPEEEWSFKEQKVGKIWTMDVVVDKSTNFTMHDAVGYFGHKPYKHHTPAWYPLKTGASYTNNGSNNWWMYVTGNVAACSGAVKIPPIAAHAKNSAVATIKFDPTSIYNVDPEKFFSGKFTFEDIVANSTLSFKNQDRTDQYTVFSISSGGMALSASLNLFQKDKEKRWTISTKYETPILNFANVDALATKAGGSSSFAGNGSTGGDPYRGMWHQYGLQCTGSEGLWLRVADSQLTIAQKSMTGSLLDACGFSNEKKKIGQIKPQKELREAVVAIPFYYDEDNKEQFFDLPLEQFEQAYSGIEQAKEAQSTVKKKGEEYVLTVENSIADMIFKMRRYNLIPQYDFVRVRDKATRPLNTKKQYEPALPPFAMYIFEFSNILSKTDLQKIWQGVLPDIGKTAQKQEITLSHELKDGELLSKSVFEEQGLEGGKIPEDIRWKIFKIKRRAANNYFEMLEQKLNLPENTAKNKSKLLSAEYGANWPYDYCSLVEFGKLETSFDFNREEKEKKEKERVEERRTEDLVLVDDSISSRDREGLASAIREKRSSTTATIMANSNDRPAPHSHEIRIDASGQGIALFKCSPESDRVCHEHKIIDFRVAEAQSDCYPECREYYGTSGIAPHTHKITLNEENIDRGAIAIENPRRIQPTIRREEIAAAIESFTEPVPSRVQPRAPQRTTAPVAPQRTAAPPPLQTRQPASNLNSGRPTPSREPVSREARPTRDDDDRGGGRY